DHSSLDHRRGLAMKGAEADIGVKSNLDTIYIYRQYLCINNELLAFGHDIENRSTRLTNTTYGMGAEAKHTPGNRRPDHSAFNPVFNGSNFLAQFIDFRLNLSQFINNLCLELFIQLK